MPKPISKKELSNLVLSSKAFQTKARKEAVEKLIEHKAEMVNEFINHPVTQEISAGPTAQNSSKTLNGKGNLFSFIGFEKSQDPISPVVDVLNRETKLTGQFYINNRGEGSLEFEYKLPSEEEISKVSQLPFESGRSWVWGIQRGISGFGFYLRKLWSSSRSGTAIQSSKKIRSASFKRTSYLSAIFNNLKNKLK